MLRIKVWHSFQTFANQVTWNFFHILFLCYSKGVLENTSSGFTKFSHVAVTQFYASEDFTLFLASRINFMLIITNLNVRCIETNVFHNGFYKHGSEIVAFVCA
jgi:hypothetical protein